MKRKIYRPPTGSKIIFKNEYKTLLEASKGSKKQFYFFCGINLNLLGYWTNKYGKTIFHFSFKTSIFPSIARPTRVTHTTATAIIHILRRNFVTKYSGIVQTDISDHFPIFTFVNEEIVMN